MRYLFSLWLFITVLNTDAQCPTCTPDISCVSPDGGPTLCPDAIPAATTGEYYEQVVTFYLPSSFVEPSLNVTVTLEQITIASVSGLPFGLSYSTNHPDGIYYPSQGDHYGCATICGTPLIAGAYDVLISVAIVASVAGFEVTDNQSFFYTLVVEQGDVSTESFTVDHVAACDALTASFISLISGSSAQHTQYFWDFGNGMTSGDQHPVVSFTTPGEFTVSLNTVISNYVLNSINLININGNGEGDVDEFFSPPADPYFTLQDGGGTIVYTSSTIDNSTQGVWTSLGIVLSNPPYSITFWDEDDVSADDNLGGFTLSFAVGEMMFDSGDGTVGTWNIDLTETANITDETTIIVFDAPDATISGNGNILSVAESDAFSYQWYLNGEIISGSEGQTHQATEGGVYTCEVTNTFGCSSLSDAYIYCEPVVPVYDAVANEIYVDNVFDSYQWFFNGLPLEGADTFYIIDPASGNYGIQVTTDYGCVTNGTVITVVNDLEEMFADALRIYPNPFHETLIFTFASGMEMPQNIRLLTADGRILQEWKGASISPNLQLNTTDWAAGYYVLQLQFADHMLSRGMVKR